MLLRAPRLAPVSSGSVAPGNAPLRIFLLTGSDRGLAGQPGLARSQPWRFGAQPEERQVCEAARETSAVMQSLDKDAERSLQHAEERASPRYELGAGKGA